jgi:hypothetical protein
MIDELLENLESTYEQEREKFYGVTVGRVINPLDPMSLGRVQVQLPFIDSLDLSPWARVAVPMAGMLHGMYFIPNLGDEVLVAFEHGDVNAPYVIGSLWNAVARPPLPSPIPQIRAIRTLSGNQIVIEEIPPAITIQTAPTPPVAMPLPASPLGPHQTIRLSPTGIEIMSPLKITLQVGLNSLTIDPTGITLMAGGNILTVSPQNISLLATDIDLTAFIQAVITAGIVRINS